jgi:ParB family chromosome partitioning protein
MQPIEDRAVSGIAVETPSVDASRSSVSARETFRHLPVELIDPCPTQPRQRMARRPLEEMIASVREHGVLQPIRVRPRGERYEIVTGERRWTAARMLGLQEIPAVIADVDDEQAGIQALVENIHREDLTVVDRARALARLRRSLGLSSWEAVGAQLGLSKGHVTRLLNVNRLAEQIREDERLADLNEKHIRALYGLRSHPALQIELWELIHRSGLSGDDALRKGLAMRAHQDQADFHERARLSEASLGAAIAALEDLAPDEVDSVRDRLVAHCVRLRQIVDR